MRRAGAKIGEPAGDSVYVACVGPCIGDFCLHAWCWIPKPSACMGSEPRCNKLWVSLSKWIVVSVQARVQLCKVGINSLAQAHPLIDCLVCCTMVLSADSCVGGFGGRANGPTQRTLPSLLRARLFRLHAAELAWSFFISLQSFLVLQQPRAMYVWLTIFFSLGIWYMYIYTRVIIPCCCLAAVQCGMYCIGSSFDTPMHAT